MDRIDQVTFVTETQCVLCEAQFKMKSIVFWDTKPCILLKFNRRFGGTYRLHLQGRISTERNQRESRVLFINTAVRTLNVSYNLD
jgi:hypothetical protein